MRQYSIKVFKFVTGIPGTYTQNQDTTNTTELSNTTTTVSTKEVTTTTELNVETTTTEVNLMTTTEPLITTVNRNYTQSISRQSRSDNGSLDDVSMDVEADTNPPDINSEKILNDKISYKLPESASRVIMPAHFLNLSNIISDGEVSNKSEVEKSPVRRLISTLDENKSKPDKRGMLKPHVQYDEVTGEQDDSEHPCHRECKEGEEPMICYYHFNLEWYQTMSKACYDCPYNITDCFRQDCIPADGMNRPLNVINRKMPGPAIEVSPTSSTQTIFGI